MSQLKSLMPRWNEAIPHYPFPKQVAALMLTQRESFFGGAAGGGKSDFLLMAALQYVDIPGYAGIIFRKTFADLSLPGALIDRSHQWLDDLSCASWAAQTHSWSFKCEDLGGDKGRSRLAFGYLADETNKYRYQSSEFQFIGFDELTHFYEDDYLFMFSRLRRPQCQWHMDGFDKECRICQEYKFLGRVPLRVRSASNPGGVGHLWVKERFDIGEVEVEVKGKKEKRFLGRKPSRPYIPSFISDNPAIDQESYRESLLELDPVTREQMLKGDWSISADGRFRKSWFKYYSRRGPYLVLGLDGKGKTIPIKDCRMFTIVDPAASAREGPGDAAVWRKAPSWTVIGTFLLTDDYDLIWWDNFRCQKEIPDVIRCIQFMYKKHSYAAEHQEVPGPGGLPEGVPDLTFTTGYELPIRPEFIGIEDSGLGIGVYQSCKKLGLPVRPLKPMSVDKLVRATDACNRAEQGQIWFPQKSGWLYDLESELFTWTAHPHQQDDQVDVLSWAAKETTRMAVHHVAGPIFDLPSVVGPRF